MQEPNQNYPWPQSLPMSVRYVSLLLGMLHLFLFVIQSSFCWMYAHYGTFGTLIIL